jgi:hypothetical protein
VADLHHARAFAEARFQRLSTVAYFAAVSLTVIAFTGGAVVLGLDLWPGFVTSRDHRLVSALPLLAIATGYLVLQLRLRPRRHELLKRALLSIAFILWSASQLARPRDGPRSPTTSRSRFSSSTSASSSATNSTQNHGERPASLAPSLPILAAAVRARCERTVV